MKPKLVIFDCDGVLVDSEALSAKVTRDNLERHGLALTLEECIQLFTGVADEDVVGIAAKRGVALPSNWVKEITEETEGVLQDGIPMVPGIPKVLATLEKAEILHCVASNGTPGRMRITLGQHGLWDRFQGRIFSGPALGLFKPEPGLFLRAAKDMQTDPVDCVVIEDSATGAMAARRAGMKCFGYAPDGIEHGSAQKLATEGAFVFTSMRDLPALLGL